MANNELTTVISEHPNTIICLKAGDLGLFARELAAEFHQTAEQIAQKNKEASRESLLDAEEVQAFLGISYSTLYRLSKAKILVPIWVGGQRRWRQSELERYLRRR